MVPALPAGRYTIRASKPAWLTAEYGAIRPGGEGTPLSIRDADRVDDIALTMHVGAVIAGTVVDRAGQPMAGWHHRDAIDLLPANGRSVAGHGRFGDHR